MAPASRTPKYIQIATYLRVVIERNHLKKGRQLPSEAELCKRFGCSRGPVRQALNMLVMEGAVQRQQGAGTFVVERAAPAKSKQILLAVIVPNMQNSAFTRAVRAFGMAANERGYTFFLGVTHESPEIERQFIDELARLRVTGVCKFPTNIELEEKVRDRFREYGVPYVIINDFWTDSQRDYHVAYDERAAVEMAVDHLVKLGHTRIGMVETSYWPRSRATHAFFRRLIRHGLPHEDNQLLLCDFSSELPPVEKLYSVGGPNPTALITVYDVFAVSVITQLRKSGMRVPEDVCVVNINGKPVEMTMDVDLTTAMPPYRKMMEQALNLVIGEMPDSHVRHYLYKPSFHVGRTTGPCTDKEPAPRHKEVVRAG